MFEKTCPYCNKPISVFSKGMLKGKFPCPHCNQNLKSGPNMVVMAVAGGVGGVVGVMLGLSLTLTVPLAIALSYPFAIAPTKIK